MKTENLNPMQSLEVIMEAIGDARSKFEEDGFIYMFWGLLITAAAMAQFIMIQNGQAAISFYPYFIIPFGGIFTGIYYRRKGEGKKMNHLNRIIMSLWLVLFLNMTILGFVFGGKIAANITPIMLILSSIGMSMSGVIIKKNLLLYAGIILNLAGMVCFLLPWQYHPLLMSIGSFAGVFLPGLLIKLQSKNV